MWTDRIETKTDYTDILEYLELMDGFHDYRIGYIDYDGEKARITVEEVLPGKDLKDDAGLIWDFACEKVRDYHFHVDCQLSFYIYEVVKGNESGRLFFELNGGYIDICANKISLGIPEKE